MRRRFSFLLATLLIATSSQASGPAWVAGKTGFNAGIAGTPLRWAGTEVVYYTDQGNLSSLEQQNSINALVADAFSRWTSVSTVALKATRAGSLDEDVSGANVTLSGSTLTVPTDIQPTSTKPMAFVYDADGAVTDALLGAGASKLCAANFVFGGPDRFTADGHIAHAVVVLNGSCVKTTVDIVVLRYHLVLAIGRALGLDWSQVNDMVETNKPASPTTDQVAGYPVMHPAGSLCTPGAGCYSNADQLRMDDRMAIARLYPVTADNLAQFPGKSIFSATTARVSGSIWFGADALRVPVQGANVVATWIDPATNTPSMKSVATSVSGYLYRGNAGNIITGYNDATGQAHDRWGSDDASLRGYYELSGLEIPAGASSAKYEITIEPLNPNYTGTISVGPFKNTQVSPPGSAATVVVTVSAGSTITQDITLTGTPITGGDLYEPNSFDSPRPIPGAGLWSASLADQGNVDWYAVDFHANHSFTLDVTAMDGGTASASKALPVIGIWDAAANASDPPLVAQTYFNAGQTGVTRLQLSLPSGSYKFAIADARGDGRPDFLYSARVLYADSVTPAHALVGDVLTISGVGFTADARVKVGSTVVPVLSFVPGELKVAAPILPDGSYAVTVEDAASGASTSIGNAVSYGGAAGTSLELLNGGNPPVPVGTLAPNPFRVRVLAADGTPVSGAAVRFVSPTPSILLQPCKTQDCTVASDGAGEALAWLLVKAEGAVTLTASLSGGANVSATVSGISAPLSVAAAPPKMFLARDSSASVPLLVRVVGNGTPLSGRLVEYSVMLGTATLSAGTATTDTNGESTTTLNIAKMASEVRVSACVGVSPQTACDVFYLYAVAMTGGSQMVKTGGDEQYINPGGLFLPLSVRLNDLSDPPFAISGAAVTFRMMACRSSASTRTTEGEVLSGHFGGEVVVASEEVTVYTNGWGEARYTPSVSEPGLLIEIHATSGGASVDFTLHTWEIGAPATKLGMPSGKRLSPGKNNARKYPLPEE
ncbi:MAG: IPT/TIG domain-containing protein [Terriglobales bacterium]